MQVFRCLETCCQTLCKADTCSCRPSHFLADSSAEALCFSICVCWMLIVFCSLARSSSISLIFAQSFAFSSSCNIRNTMSVFEFKVIYSMQPVFYILVVYSHGNCCLTDVYQVRFYPLFPSLDGSWLFS